MLSTASFSLSASTPRSLRLGGESFWAHLPQSRRERRGCAEKIIDLNRYLVLSYEPLTASTFPVQSQQQRPPARTKPLRRPDVIYYPTPDETVAEMLRLANIKPGDVLYDLGSGDGRIPIAAAKQYGIRTVGIEIDPKLVAIARERAQASQVSDLVSFSNADMFRTNIREASVVTLYLSNKINLLLRPKLLRELRPGTRIISHDFHMGDWEPEQTVRVPWKGDLYRTIYLWTVPVKKRKTERRKAERPIHTPG